MKALDRAEAHYVATIENMMNYVKVFVGVFTLLVFAATIYRLGARAGQVRAGPIIQIVNVDDSEERVCDPESSSEDSFITIDEERMHQYRRMSLHEARFLSGRRYNVWTDEQAHEMTVEFMKDLLSPAQNHLVTDEMALRALRGDMVPDLSSEEQPSEWHRMSEIENMMRTRLEDALLLGLQPWDDAMEYGSYRKARVLRAEMAEVIALHLRPREPPTDCNQIGARTTRSSKSIHPNSGALPTRKWLMATTSTPMPRW